MFVNNTITRNKYYFYETKNINKLKKILCKTIKFKKVTDPIFGRIPKKWIFFYLLAEFFYS